MEEKYLQQDDMCNKHGKNWQISQLSSTQQKDHCVAIPRSVCQLLAGSFHVAFGI